MTTNPSRPSRGQAPISPLRRMAALALVLFLTLAAHRPAAALTGGPDAFGYTFTDTASGGVSYNFENISGSGTVAESVSNTQDAKQSVPIGFTFSFYGNSYANCDLSTHGHIGFNDFGGNGSIDFSNDPIPNAGGVNEIIAGWWDDLNPGSAGTIFYQTLGTAPQRRFIVQYDGVAQSGSASTVTFQFKLFEGSNKVEIHYASVPAAGSASIGIENAGGTVGLQYFSGAGLPPIGAGPFALSFAPNLVTNASNAGAGSLRQAIANAPAGSAINFDPSLSGQTITLGGTELLLNKNLTIDASGLSGGLTISGNNASRVLNIPTGNTVTLDGLTITGGGGAAGGGGGGIRNEGTLFLNRCMVSGNTVPGGNWGGGIFNSGGILNATNCTVVNNSAEYGGGIFSDGTGTLSHVTVTNNTAVSGGGGLWLNAGTVTIHNSIFAENFYQVNVPQDVVPAGASVLNQTGVNLIGGDPQLAPLGNYGGPMLTRAPVLGSPAVNTATGGSPATDQRGFARPLGAGPDIGAVESNFDLMATTSADSGAGSLRDTIALAIPGSSITFDAGLNGQTVTLGGSELLLAKNLTIDATGLAAGLGISGNNASRVFNIAAGTTVTLNGLTITGGGGAAGGGGGGIRNLGTLFLNRSTVSGNTVPAGNWGGGVFNSGGTLTATLCTFANNSAEYGGGFFSDGTATLVHTTIAANSAGTGGGGLWRNGGTIAVTNTIISGNLAPNAPDQANGVNETGVNLIGGDPKLAPLAYHGGPTPTMPPLATSAAIDHPAASATSPLTADQRGYTRVVGGKVDIGAVEAGPAITVANANDSGAGSLRQAIADATTPGQRILFAAGLNGSTITLTSGELAVGASLTVTVDGTGLSSGITVSGGGASRVMTVPAGGTVTLAGLAITGGNGAGILVGGIPGGGALQNVGTLNLSKSSVSGNAAGSNGSGGGILNHYDGTVTVNDSTVTNNSADLGGGIYSFASLSLRHVTVSDNVASGSSSTGAGGGLRAIDGTVSIINCIIARNTATTDDAPDFAKGNSVIVTPGGVNLIGDNTSVTAEFPAGPLAGTAGIPLNPRLGSPGSHGGPGQTLAPLPGSPAIDAVAAMAGTPVTDQRGRPRAADGDGNGSVIADIGAFEVGISQVTTAANSGAGSLRDLVEGPNTGHEWITFDPAVFNGSPAATITLASQLTVTGKVLHLDARNIPSGVTLNGNNLTRGILIDSASTVEIDRMTVTRCFATGRGGGIFNHGKLTIRDSTFSHNYASQYGGGIDNAGTLSVTNCTVANNAAASDAGGIDNYQGVSMVLINSTLSGNASGGYGGGIWSDLPLTLSNSLIAGNRAIAHNDLSGAATTNLGGNLIGDGTGTGGVTSGVNGDQVGTGSAPIDPRLAPLGRYGGPTETMALLVGSPAINAGFSSGTIPATDQRGFPRVGTADIGALEAGPVLLVSYADDAPLPDNLRWAIANATAPGSRILFNLDVDSVTTLTAGELVVESGRSIFIDASSLVDGNGQVRADPDPLRPGATFTPRGTTVSGGGNSRVFTISGGSSAAMHHLTVTGGSTTGNGGGINNGGDLTMVDSTINGCATTYRGGGMTNLGFASLIRSTVSNNQSTELGAGIENVNQLSLANSTVSGNSTPSVGGGIFNFSRMTLANSTIAGNSAGVGGGMVTQDGIISLENTVIAGNTATDSVPDVATGGSNAFTTGQGNFIGDNSQVSAAFPAGSPNLNGDFAGTNAAPLDPMLGALADHGGPTFTMAPQAGSPLLDAGDATGVPPFTDQRGFARILAGGIDIGAHEAGAGDFNPAGLTLFAKVPAAVGNGGTMRFEISTDADFFATAETIAGNGTAGAANGPALDSQFNFPSDVVEDGSGNVFIADSGNNRIRMRTPEGVVSTIAGTGAFGLVNGDGPAAKFAFPAGVAVGPDDNVYVSDTINHCIRKLTRPALPGLPWTVSTLAGTGIAGFTEGLGTVARFHHPHALAFGIDGNLYVADTLNHRIRKVTPAGVVGTHAGTGASGTTDGNRLIAMFSSPFGVAADADGNLFVADTGNHRIRRIGDDGEVTTIAGFNAGFLDGFGTDGQFNTPTGVAVDGEGSLVVADQGNHAIRRVAKPINPEDDWETTTTGGTGAAGFAEGRTTSTGAQFNYPTGLCVAADGRVIVADRDNHRIRRISDPLSIDALAGLQDRFGLNFSAVIDAALLGLVPETTYYFRWVAADGSTQETGESFTLVPIPTVVTTPASAVTRVAATINGTVDPNGNATTVTFDYSTDPGLLGPLAVATLGDGFAGPRGLAVDSGGNVFVAAADSHKILKITPGGVVSDFAGSGTAGFANGTGAAARFDHPLDVAIDGSDNLYVADELNHRIRKITPAGVVSTIAGSGVAGYVDAAAALTGRFLFPCGIAVNTDASQVYVADRGNQRIRIITGGSNLGTLAGDGTAGFLDGPAAAAQFNNPTGVAVDASGNVFVADRDNHRVRVVNTSEEVLTVAGTGAEGFLDGDGAFAEFAFPSGVAIDGGGVLYVTDRDNHRLRTIDGFGFVTTLAGSGIEGVLDTPLAGELWPATATRFSSPGNVAVDAATGDLFLTEAGSQSVRKVSRDALLSITLPGTYGSNGDIDLGTGIPETLVPGATYYFRVRASNSQGPATGQILSFTTPTEPRIAVFEGIGGAAAAMGNAQPAAIDFGVTPLGTPVTRRFTITNTGGWDLSVGAITVPAGYRVRLPLAGDGEPFTLDTFGSNYDTELGLFNAAGTLLASVDDSGGGAQSLLNMSSGLPQGTYHLALGGYNTTFADGFSAIGGAYGGSYVLNHPGGTQSGSQVTGGHYWFTFQIGEGSGDTAGAPAGTWLSGADPGVVAPGDSVTLEITLEATVGGTFDGMVEIPSDDPELGNFTFPVTGVVLDPPGVTTLEATDTVVDNLTSTFSTTFQATVNPEGSDTTAWFEYSPDAEFDGLRVTTIAGAGDGYAEGTGIDALFNQPSGLATDAAGNIYVADTMNHRIRVIAPDGSSGTVAGTGVAGFADGPAASAQFNQPAGLAIGSDGTLFVADSLNHRIRAISPGGEVTTYCGLGTPGHTDGVAGAARFNVPKGLAIDAAGNLHVVDVVNQYIRKVATDGSASTLTDTFGQPSGIAASADGTVYFSVSNIIRRITPGGVTGDFVGDYFIGGHVNAAGAAARFSSPAGLALDTAGNLFVADRGNHRVRKVAPDGTVTDFAGSGIQGTVDGLGEEARFDNPFALAVDALGDVIAGDSGQSTVRRIAPTRVLVQVATGLTGDTGIAVSYLATGLESGTTYYFRAIATNFVGTTVGDTLNISGGGSPFQTWQAAEFGPDAENPLIAGEGANPTKDGVANLLKYALFLDPNVASQAGLPVLGLGGGGLTLTYTKVVSATDLNYVVECSTDLLDWSPAGVTEQDIGGDTVTRQIRASAPVAGIPAKFIRLNVTLQQP